MLKIFKNLKPFEFVLIALSVGFVVLQVWLDLEIPDYMAKITDLIRAESKDINEILIAGGYMLACALGSLISSVIVAIISAKIAANFSANLRAKLFDKVQSFSMEEVGKFSTASLITRSTNDITQVQILIVMGLQVVTKAPIMAIWAVTKISGKAWQWALSTGMAIAILLIIVVICIGITIPKFKKLQKLTDDVNRVTRENLTGLNVVRAYNAEAYQNTKFEQVNTNLTNTNLFANRVMSFMMPSIFLIMNGLTLAIYWIGSALIANASFPNQAALFTDMVVYSSYAMQVVMSFMMLVMIFIILPRALVSAKRVNEVLETKLSIADGELIPDNNKKGEIEFNNVCFKYPGSEKCVIENINFKTTKGDTLAIIGATGCGKSTIINLIPRFFDATEGEVLVDGLNVKSFKQNALRNKIGYVSQKSFLFSGDIKSNVSFGDNGITQSDEEIENNMIKSIETAQAKNFVESKEDKYNAEISQGGSNLSGGQKQRISIARALCRKPEILIFDDSFSALDYKTDRELRNKLKIDCADVTKIIVAQRIGTIRDADKILVLDKGKIVGNGTHDELISNCEVYKEIALSQLSKEEL